eukprot:756694-Hanusia_phi.AAC.2
MPSPRRALEPYLCLRSSQLPPRPIALSPSLPAPPGPSQSSPLRWLLRTSRRACGSFTPSPRRRRWRLNMARGFPRLAAIVSHCKPSEERKGEAA